MANTYTNLLYHIVFSTKRRLNTINPVFEKKLYDYIGGIIKGENGILLNAGGISNHIHLLVKISPSLAPSDTVKRIKGNSSKWIQYEIGTPFEWQRGYGAFSVSESAVNKTSSYINNQLEHHKNISFKEEYITLLEKHNIEYDEKYLWN